MDNLITSCQSCNLGKSATPLTVIPKSLKDKASEISEREAQIKGYNSILQDRANRIEDEAWEIAAILERKDYLESYNSSNLASIKMFLERLAFQEVIDSAMTANSRWSNSNNRHFKYFCGICWNKIRGN